MARAETPEAKAEDEQAEGRTPSRRRPTRSTLSTADPPCRSPACSARPATPRWRACSARCRRGLASRASRPLRRSSGRARRRRGRRRRAGMEAGAFLDAARGRGRRRCSPSSGRSSDRPGARGSKHWIAYYRQRRLGRGRGGAEAVRAGRGRAATAQDYVTFVVACARASHPAHHRRMRSHRRDRRGRRRGRPRPRRRPRARRRRRSRRRGDASAPAASPGLIGGRLGAGEQLDTATECGRAAYGADFSDVRVHRGRRARWARLRHRRARRHRRHAHCVALVRTSRARPDRPRAGARGPADDLRAGTRRAIRRRWRPTPTPPPSMRCRRAGPAGSPAGAAQRHRLRAQSCPVPRRSSSTRRPRTCARSSGRAARDARARG